MNFEPLYYKDKLVLCNPLGDIAVTTLWTPPYKMFDKYGWLDRVAVIGGLYGNGLQEMLLNLLYNPQIRYVLIDGNDLGTAGRDLRNFFVKGVVEENYYGVAMNRIIGTDRYIHRKLTPDLFNIIVVTSSEECEIDYRSEPTGERVKLDIDLSVKAVYNPSDMYNHTVAGDTINEVWEKLVAKIVRFGVPVELQKGLRLELRDVKAIIHRPNSYGHEKYGQSLFDAMVPIEQTYTYGNRLHRWFDVPQIMTIIDKLKKDKENRSSYCTTWDPKVDGWLGSKGHPCLVSLFFRKDGDALSMTATFRTHNALDGWPRNAGGLSYILEHVAIYTEMKVGTLVIVSHSCTIDPAGGGMQRAQAVADSRKVSMVTDPNGSFTFTKDGDYIVAHHSIRGVFLKEYKAKTPEHLARQLLKDDCISDIGHAIYIGSQLEKLR